MNEMKRELIKMIGSIEGEKAIRNFVKDYLKSSRQKKEKIQSPIADQSKDCIQ